MFDFISGLLSELTPSYAVVETNGIGWLINISLNTYSIIQGKDKCKLYVCHIVREDAQLLYGFADKGEREIFNLLCSVSGIGPNTARVILSSLSPAELQNAILGEDSKTISKVKGIGVKTAQRVVIDLKDKIKKTSLTGDSSVAISPMQSTNEHREEAVAALVMLGYTKQLADKAVDMALKQDPSMSTEVLIKFALRNVK